MKSRKEKKRRYFFVKVSKLVLSWIGHAKILVNK
jgi:hypothetical protein